MPENSIELPMLDKSYEVGPFIYTLKIWIIILIIVVSACIYLYKYNTEQKVSYYY